MRWSVIICTRNRCDLLRRCLAALAELAPPEGGMEFVVVDNASGDDTPRVAADAAEASQPVVYVREETPGLSPARNRGIAVSRGDFIAFLDDDARPEPLWLRELDAAFAGDRVGCAGGRVVPEFDGIDGWPAWLSERFIGFFTVVDYGARTELHYPDYPSGTNFAVRRTAADRVGGFDRRLGRSGESLLSMEEIDFCLRLEQQGFSVRYAPGAVVRHTVHRERLTPAWLEERLRAQGVSAAILERQRLPLAAVAARIARYLLFLPAAAVASSLLRAAGNEKSGQFFRLQGILCRAYLKTAAGFPGKS